MKKAQIQFMKREVQALQKDGNSQMTDYVAIGGSKVFQSPAEFLTVVIILRKQFEK